MGRATLYEYRLKSERSISIHALRGEGDRKALYVFLRIIVISIHALRGEGDVMAILKIAGIEDISIHALRGEGDACWYWMTSQQKDFNPRPPWGGRQANKVDWSKKIIFQSTPSVGRATLRSRFHLSQMSISIHALRGEGDRRPS